MNPVPGLHTHPCPLCLQPAPLTHARPGLPREVKEPGSAGATAHEKRRLHYQQLMKERQQAQREKKEKEEEDGEAPPHH